MAEILSMPQLFTESYQVVESMARDLDCSIIELLNDEELRHRIDLPKYVTEAAGIPTLTDILAELAKPGRDPRQQFEVFTFSEEVQNIDDLRPGMKLPGIITNVTAFGAFVDVGVHQDGLVHVSQLADRFVKDPRDVVKAQQQVTVTVLEVDLDRKRISLSMKTNPGKSAKRGKRESKHERNKKVKRKKQEKDSAPFNNPFADAFKK